MNTAQSLAKIENRIDRKELQCQILKDEGVAHYRTVEMLMQHYESLEVEQQKCVSGKRIQDILGECDRKSVGVAAIMGQLERLEEKKRKKREELSKQD